MTKRCVFLSLIIWLGLSCTAQAQILPDPSTFLSSIQYNAFGRRPSEEELSPNAFAKEPAYDQSLHAAVQGGLRDQAWLGPKLILDIDYLMYFVQPAKIPPLLTTGSVTDTVPGALGQPNTVVLDSGSRDYGQQPGARFRLTRVLVEQLEVITSYYLTEQKSDILDWNSNAAGTPVLTRPFFNPVTNSQDADPRALPSTFQGFTHRSLSNRLQGGEFLVRWSEAPRSDGPSWSFSGGLTYLQFDERLYLADYVKDLPIGSGNNTTFIDDFGTNNQFYGATFGSQYDCCFPDCVLTFYSKFSAGTTYQSLRISGATVQTNQISGATFVDNNQGLYAEPTNVGSYHRWNFGMVEELGLNFGYNLHERVRLQVGYSFMYVVGVIRPGDQVNTNVNVQPLFTNVITPPFQPSVTSLDQTSLWLQNLSFGLRFLF